MYVGIVYVTNIYIYNIYIFIFYCIILYYIIYTPKATVATRQLQGFVHHAPGHLVNCRGAASVLATACVGCGESTKIRLQLCANIQVYGALA